MDMTVADGGRTLHSMLGRSISEAVALLKSYTVNSIATRSPAATSTRFLFSADSETYCFVCFLSRHCGFY
jgi:hypothetical protein